MTGFRLMGVAAVLFSVLTAPAIAGHHARRIANGPGYPAQSLFCATRDAGNPHSKYCDYVEWSKWRSRGAWDSSLDNACLQNPAFVPGECSFDPHGRVLFGAHP